MIKSRLHILMHEKGIRSVAKLSKETGLSRPTLYRIYNDSGDRVEYGTLNALCSYFHCSVGELLEFVPD
jgi:putative transcriptional regulator